MILGLGLDVCSVARMVEFLARYGYRTEADAAAARRELAGVGREAQHAAHRASAMARRAPHR